MDSTLLRSRPAVWTLAGALLALLIAATGTGAGVVTAHFLDRVKVE
jgi:hypothetical protein